MCKYRSIERSSFRGGRSVQDKPARAGRKRPGRDIPCVVLSTRVNRSALATAAGLRSLSCNPSGSAVGRNHPPFLARAQEYLRGCKHDQKYGEAKPPALKGAVVCHPQVCGGSSTSSTPH